MFSEDQICSVEVPNSQIDIWLASSLVKHRPGDPRRLLGGPASIPAGGNVFGAFCQMMERTLVKILP